MLANIYSILVLPVNRATAYIYKRTHDVGLLTQFRFNVGPASQPISASMMVNRLRCWPNTNPTLGLLYTCHSANTCHSPNAVSMLKYSLRRWPSIEIALGDCPVFSGVLPHSNAGDAFLPRRQKGHFPDNIIANCPMLMYDGPPSATLSQHYLAQNPLSSNHKYNREYYFSQHI